MRTRGGSYLMLNVSTMTTALELAHTSCHRYPSTIFQLRTAFYGDSCGRHHPTDHMTRSANRLLTALRSVPTGKRLVISASGFDGFSVMIWPVDLTWDGGPLNPDRRWLLGHNPERGQGNSQAWHHVRVVSPVATPWRCIVFFDCSSSYNCAFDKPDQDDEQAYFLSPRKWPLRKRLRELLGLANPVDITNKPARHPANLVGKYIR